MVVRELVATLGIDPATRWQATLDDGAPAFAFLVARRQGSLQEMSRLVAPIMRIVSATLSVLGQLEEEFAAPRDEFLPVSMLSDVRLVEQQVVRLLSKTGAAPVTSVGGDALVCASRCLSCHTMDFATAEMQHPDVRSRLDPTATLAVFGVASPHKGGTVISLAEVVASQSDPDKNFSPGWLDEEVAWKLIAALVSAMNLAHAMGHSYLGLLTTSDVLLMVSDSRGNRSAAEFFLPPPFSAVCEQRQPSTAELQSEDVRTAGLIANSVAQLLQQSPSGSQQQVSAELLFLIRKMVGNGAEAATRPTASQLMQFQAIRLRNRQWMIARSAENARRSWLSQQRQLAAHCEMLKHRLSLVEPATARQVVDRGDLGERERSLAEREKKLAAFLELYELTTLTLDSLPINERTTTDFKDRLSRASDSSSVGPKASPSPLKGSVDGGHKPPPSPELTSVPNVGVAGEPMEPSVARSCCTPPGQAALAFAVVAPLSPVAAVEDTSTEHHRSPSAKSFLGAGPKGRSESLNESIEIEVIEVEASLDDSAEVDTKRTSPLFDRGQVRRERLRHARRQHQTERTHAESSAWMHQHVTQLEKMQQELHRSRQTPTKETKVAVRDALRRSPSESHTRSRGASRSLSNPGAEDVLDDDPVLLLRKLRETVVV